MRSSRASSSSCLCSLPPSSRSRRPPCLSRAPPSPPARHLPSPLPVPGPSSPAATPSQRSQPELHLASFPFPVELPAVFLPRPILLSPRTPPSSSLPPSASLLPVSHPSTTPHRQHHRTQQCSFRRRSVPRGHRRLPSPPSVFLSHASPPIPTSRRPLPFSPHVPRPSSTIPSSFFRAPGHRRPPPSLAPALAPAGPCRQPKAMAPAIPISPRDLARPAACSSPRARHPPPATADTGHGSAVGAAVVKVLWFVVAVLDPALVCVSPWSPLPDVARQAFDGLPARTSSVPPCPSCPPFEVIVCARA